MGGRIQTEPTVSGTSLELRIEASVEVDESGNGEVREASLGGPHAAFRSRPTVLLDATTPDGVTVENVNSDSFDVVCEGIDPDHREDGWSSRNQVVVVRVVAKGDLEIGKHTSEV